MKPAKKRVGISDFGGYVLSEPVEKLTMGDLQEYAPFHFTRGAIGMLDVLGAKRFDSFQALDFMEYRDNIVGKSHILAERILKLVNDAIRATVNPERGDVRQVQEARQALVVHSGIQSIRWMFVGDTICLIVHGDSPYISLPAAAAVLLPIIPLAIEQGIPFRGALSYGEYINDHTTLLGEAVARSASEYEQADWLGIAFSEENSDRI